MLMKSAAGNNGNRCSTNEDREIAEVSQALKCTSKRKKSLYAQSRNELHCKMQKGSLL